MNNRKVGNRPETETGSDSDRDKNRFSDRSEHNVSDRQIRLSETQTQTDTVRQQPGNRLSVTEPQRHDPTATNTDR